MLLLTRALLGRTDEEEQPQQEKTREEKEAEIIPKFRDSIGLGLKARAGG